MPEPTTTGIASWLGSKLLPPVLGFVGATLMLLHTREMDPRRMVVAIVAGVISAWLVPPIVVAGARHSGFGWLPTDGSVESVLGFLVGLGAFNLVGVWLRSTRDPHAAFKRGGEQ